MFCPYCGYQNIEGASDCDECQQPLTDLHLPAPANEVERSLIDDRVTVLAPKEPVAVTSSATVGEVLSLLIEKGIGCVLIVDGGELTGIFTEQDALKRLGSRAAELGNEPISKYMTSDPQTLQDDVKVAFAVHRMDLGGYRHVPIMGDGLQGVISVRDILCYLADKMAPT